MRKARAMNTTWTMETLLGCLLALTSLTTGGCVAGERDDGSDDEASAMRSAPATRTIQVLHWNISGAVLNKGFYDVVDAMYDEFVAKAPDVVSINEGCRDQVEHLRDRLRAAGHAVTLQFAPTGNNALCVRSLGTNTMQAGPAVLVVAGGTDGKNHYWDGPRSVDTRTSRGMACLTADLGRKVRFCSLHLATQDAEAAAQTESMLERFGASFREAPTVLLGDFNAAPDHFQRHAPNLYAPRGLFFEADARANTATHREGKIDYVFMSKGHFEEETVTEVKDMGGHDPWWGDRRAFSDHRLMHGAITLKLDD